MHPAIKYLADRPYIAKTRVEKAIGLKQGTIRKWIKRETKEPKDIDKLVAFLDEWHSFWNVCPIGLSKALHDILDDAPHDVGVQLMEYLNKNNSQN